MRRRIHLLDTAFPGRPALDTAFSRALLDLVARGEAPETFRLYRTDDVLAFSGVDAASPGFASAVAAARALGFAPALRLAGGRAAVFTRETLAFAWTIPASESRDGIHPRFEELADLVAAALRRLGVDARVGEVPGEYCPGEYSVSARGAKKLMGVGQRVVRGAAHVGGVVVVERADRVRDALVPVYDAMGFDWAPDTTGAIADEAPGATLTSVAAALEAELRARYDVVAGGVPVAVAAERAAPLEARFEVGGGSEPRGAPAKAG
ncbi:MAG: lipoate--protein ligase [Proteobacteria bacterium]|nr:MAG: lipoate--protein ligase [Pseudomonadota bacterium]